VLDTGAGTGAFLSVMAEKGWEVKGLEPDDGARQNAEKLYE
jgi:2-polyprenyl-3-methyl-5-hydroxy-6-metoxy-1,4-benzoquinol methylase